MNYPFSDTSRTRAYPAWASALLMFGFWLASQIATIPFIMPFAMSAAGSDGGLSANANTLMIIVALASTSVAMLVLVLAWAQRMERRDRSDLGLRFDGHGWRQYRSGIGIGLLFVLSLVLLVALVQNGLVPGSGTAPKEPIVPVWSKLADPLLWIIIAALAPLFALQGASEEVLCRGWLLSSLTQRKGLRFGLFFSSFLFACMHVRYFFIDGLQFSGNQMLTGTIGIGAMFAMGLMLAMLCLRDRSIMGASGLHGGFNFAVISFGIVSFAVRSEEETIPQAFGHSFNQSTELASVQPALVMQLLLSLLVAGFLFRRFGLPLQSQS